MKEFLVSQIEEKREKKVQERFKLKKEESNQMKEEFLKLKDEDKLIQIEKMNKVTEYKKMLSDQIASKPEEQSMTEIEKKINKNLLEKIK